MCGISVRSRSAKSWLAARAGTFAMTDLIPTQTDATIAAALILTPDRHRETMFTLSREGAPTVSR
jgi:hypothetical protein